MLKAGHSPSTIANPYLPSATDSSRNIDSFLTLQAKAPRKSTNQVPVDTHRPLLIALTLLGIENLIVFAFQLISYLTLIDFWNKSSWITGTILLVCYLIIVAAVIFVYSPSTMFQNVILKLLEFLLFFFLTSWAVAYIDFAAMCSTYLVVADCILLLIALSTKSMKLWPHIIMIFLISGDAIAKALTISKWYYSVVMLVVMACRIVSLNYYVKRVHELSGMHSPMSYLGETYEITMRLWVNFFLRRKMKELEKEASLNQNSISNNEA